MSVAARPRGSRTVRVRERRAVTVLAGGTRRAADVRMMDEAVRDYTAATPPRIIALAFDSPPLAQHALHEARRLHDEHQLAVHDAVVVSAEHGTATVIESLDPTPLAAAVPSALLGALVGSIVAGPLGFLIGGVIAGATGVLVTKLVDTGIPHRLVAGLRKSTKPGQAVVALLVTDERGPGVDELRHLPGAHVVYDH